MPKDMENVLTDEELQKLEEAKKKMKKEGDGEVADDGSSTTQKSLKVEKKKMKKEEDDPDEDDGDEDEDEDDDKKKEKMKKDDDDDMDEGFDVSQYKVNSDNVDLSEELDRLFGSDNDLPEDFKNRFTAIFESAVLAQVNGLVEKIAEEMKSHYDEEFGRAIEESIDEMSLVVQEHLNEVVNKWYEDNKTLAENNIRAEMATNLMAKLKAVYEEFNIDIDEEKVDVIASLEEKIAEADTIIAAKTDKIVKLEEDLNKKNKEQLVDKLSEGLSLAQKERFKHYSQAVEEDEGATLEEKLSYIKEHYFGEKSDTTSLEDGDSVLAEEVTEEDKSTKKEDDDTFGVAQTADFISKWVSKT